MRALALLLVLSPTLAFAKRHGHEKPRPPAAVESEAPAPAAAPVRSTVMVEQADDDERPGSRQKK